MWPDDEGELLLTDVLFLTEILLKRKLSEIKLQTNKTLHTKI